MVGEVDTENVNANSPMSLILVGLLYSCWCSIIIIIVIIIINFLKASLTIRIAIYAAPCLDTHAALTLTQMRLVVFSHICKLTLQTIYFVC